MHRDDLGRDSCGIAQTLGVAGDWWTWLILRELAGQVSRFDRLQAALGISRRALTERLTALVADGVVERRPYSTHPPRHDYVLTRMGEGMVPVLIAMQEFGDRYLLGDGEVTATTRSGSDEAARVHQLVGRTLPTVKLASYQGNWVDVRPAESWRVIYAFPGAFAPDDAQGYPPGWAEIPGAAGCTLESTTYASRYDDLARLGADVVGVSTQRPDQQEAFARSASLPFRLLSDQNLALAAALRLPVFRVAGVDRLKRASLLVDPDRVVRHVQMPITDPADSVEDMLRTLAAMTAAS